jgi:uncharacterized membrane protein
MAPAVFQDFRLEPSPLEKAGRGAYLALLLTWGGCYLWVFIGFLTGAPGEKHWLNAVLLILSCLTAMANLGRQLPLQNVLGAACVIGGMGAVVHGINAMSGIPLGPGVYSLDIGRPVFDFVPWPMPFIWVLFLVSSRGTARLMLRPWRFHHSYGFWLLGVTLGLALLLEHGMEIFASRVFNYWHWEPTKIPVDWFGIPLVSFFGWGIAGLLILVFATPFLISKKPGPPARPDFVPLLLWTSASVLFIAGALHAGTVAAAIVQLSGTVLTAVFALAGSRAKL